LQSTEAFCRCPLFLAVEEQFYIGWFFVIIFLRPQSLLVVSGLMIAVAVAFRVAVFPNIMENYQLLACIDALALGALLNFVANRAPRWTAPACVALALAAVALTLGLSPGDILVSSFCPLLIALAGMCAVWNARDNVAGPAGFVLSWKPVTYLGRISYGIYIYHMLPLGKIPFFWQAGIGQNFAFHVCLTIAIAATSYHLLEQPILNVRRVLRATGGAE